MKKRWTLALSLATLVCITGCPKVERPKPTDYDKQDGIGLNNTDFVETTGDGLYDAIITGYAPRRLLAVSPEARDMYAAESVREAVTLTPEMRELMHRITDDQRRLRFLVEVTSYDKQHPTPTVTPTPQVAK